jgi:hypothetical protein
VRQPTIVIDGVVKTRAGWEQTIVDDTARLDRITNVPAREITEQHIAKIRAALA